MNEYIQFPRYSIFLIPSDKFFSDLKSFINENNADYNKSTQSIYGIHSTVKAPFYKSHLYSEENLIEYFKSIKDDKIQNIFEKKFNFKKFGKFNNTLIVELDTDPDFHFFIHDLIRSFDLFRKTLDNKEIKKDLYRFGHLSEEELFNYQVWGYPYYFDCYKHHISISNYNQNFINFNFQPVKYVSLMLLKQESAGEPFKELSVISSKTN